MACTTLVLHVLTFWIQTCSALIPPCAYRVRRDTIAGPVATSRRFQCHRLALGFDSPLDRWRPASHHSLRLVRHPLSARPTRISHHRSVSPQPRAHPVSASAIVSWFIISPVRLVFGPPTEAQPGLQWLLPTVRSCHSPPRAFAAADEPAAAAP